MKLFKVTTIFVLPLLVPVLLSGCDGGGETKSEGSPVAAKPEDAKAESGIMETYKEAGLQFTLPKGWKATTTKVSGGSMRKIASPSDMAGILLMVPNGGDVRKFVANMRADNKKNFKNYKEGKEETQNINGLQYKYFPATGDDIDVGPTMFTTGYFQAGKPVCMMVIVPQAEEKALSPVIDEFMDSMKKM